MKKQRWEDSEEDKKEDQRSDRVRRKKMQVREKVEKSRNPAFFQCFAAPEGRKVGSLKPGAKPSGEMRDKKLQAVVARSTFSSQNVT